MNFSHVFAIGLLLFGVAGATMRMPLEFPAEPSSAEVFEKSSLANADEETLIRYAQSHWDLAGYRISDVTVREQKDIETETFRRAGDVSIRQTTDNQVDVEAERRRRNEDAGAYLTMARAQLTVNRLNDPRRIVDAVIRHLGKVGTEISLGRLLELSALDERTWVRWKFLASAQENTAGRTFKAGHAANDAHWGGYIRSIASRSRPGSGCRLGLEIMGGSK